MERTSTYIKFWFWPRDSKTVPLDVKIGTTLVDPSTWGTPFAAFVNTSCDIASHFGPENIIIDLTFCGGWAGNPDVYKRSGCPGTCVGECFGRLGMRSELIMACRLREQQPGRIQGRILGYRGSSRVPVRNWIDYK
jgi:hypothetical protein